MHSENSDESDGGRNCVYEESIVHHTQKPLSKAARKRKKQQQKAKARPRDAESIDVRQNEILPLAAQQQLQSPPSPLPPPRAWGPPRTTKASPPPTPQKTAPAPQNPKKGPQPDNTTTTTTTSTDNRNIRTIKKKTDRTKMKPAPYVFSEKSVNPQCVVVDAATLLRNELVLTCLEQLLNHRRIELIIPVEVIQELDRVEKEARAKVLSTTSRGGGRHENGRFLDGQEENTQQTERGGERAQHDLSSRVYPALPLNDSYAKDMEESEGELWESSSESTSEDSMEDEERGESNAKPKWQPPRRVIKFCNTAAKLSLGMEFYSQNLWEGSAPSQSGSAERSELENYVSSLRQAADRKIKEQRRQLAPQKIVGKGVAIAEFISMCRNIFSFTAAGQKRGKILAKRNSDGPRMLDVGVTVSGSKERFYQSTQDANPTVQSDVVSCAEWYQEQFDTRTIALPTISTTGKRHESVLIITNDPTLDTIATRRGLSIMTWEEFILSHL